MIFGTPYFDLGSGAIDITGTTAYQGHTGTDIDAVPLAVGNRRAVGSDPADGYAGRIPDTDPRTGTYALLAVVRS